MPESGMPNQCVCADEAAQTVLVVQHLFDALFLRFVNGRVFAELALGLGRLLGQNVTPPGFFALHFAASGFLEAFAGTAVRFHLRHRRRRLSVQRARKSDDIACQKGNP